MTRSEACRSSADSGASTDLVLATEREVDPALVSGLLGALMPDVSVLTLVSSRPLFWTRILSPVATTAEPVASCVARAGVALRYLVSGCAPGPPRGPRLDWSHATTSQPRHWKPRSARPSTKFRVACPRFGDLPTLGVIRRWCGSGQGARLAVIGDDGGMLERLDLDAIVAVEAGLLRRESQRAASVVAWAVRTALSKPGEQFVGVAPDASPRLYLASPQSSDLVSLPLAIVRAVEDGADVIVCTQSPIHTPNQLLDDALDYALGSGREGRGTPVLFPAQVAIQPGLVHLGSVVASVQETMRLPAYRVVATGVTRTRARSSGKGLPPSGSPPGVFGWCVPACLPRPFTGEQAEPCEEALQAAAVAAGYMLLVLGKHPYLRLRDLESLLVRTGRTSCYRPARGGAHPLEGRNAEFARWYPRIEPTQACLGASDPVALALVSAGDPQAASLYHERRKAEPSLPGYSTELGTWAVAQMLRDPPLARCAQLLVRYLRLVSRQGWPTRLRSGMAWSRRLLSALARLEQAAYSGGGYPKMQDELHLLVAELSRISEGKNAEQELVRLVVDLARRLWPSSVHVPQEGGPHSA